MSIVDLGKALERFLRCTDTVIDTFSGPDSAHASEPRRSKATNAYNESLIAMHSVWAQLEDRMQASGIAGKAACARGWLSAHLERNLFLRSELLLATVREQSEIAASNESHHKTRCAKYYAAAFRRIVHAVWHVDAMTPQRGLASIRLDKLTHSWVRSERKGTGTFAVVAVTATLS